MLRSRSVFAVILLYATFPPSALALSDSSESCTAEGNCFEYEDNSTTVCKTCALFAKTDYLAPLPQGCCFRTSQGQCSLTPTPEATQQCLCFDDIAPANGCAVCSAPLDGSCTSCLSKYLWDPDNKLCCLPPPTPHPVSPVSITAFPLTALDCSLWVLFCRLRVHSSKVC